MDYPPKVSSWENDFISPHAPDSSQYQYTGDQQSYSQQNTFFPNSQPQSNYTNPPRYTATGYPTSKALRSLLEPPPKEGYYADSGYQSAASGRPQFSQARYNDQYEAPSTDSLSNSVKGSSTLVSTPPAARPTLNRLAAHSLARARNQRNAIAASQPVTSQQSCHLCGQTCPSAALLQAHLQKHETGDLPEKKFSCAYCSYATMYRQNLFKHTSSVHSDTAANQMPQQPAPQSTLEDTYPGIEELLSEPGQHETPCVDQVDSCPTQPEVTSTVGANALLSTRGSSEGHQCPSCFKKFRTKQKFNYHKDRHDPRKPYLCNVPDCERAFRTQKYLQNHMNDHHGKSKQHNCSYAGCAFVGNRRIDVKRHIAEQHLGKCKRHIIPRHSLLGKLDLSLAFQPHRAIADRLSPLPLSSRALNAALPVDQTLSCTSTWFVLTVDPRLRRPFSTALKKFCRRISPSWDRPRLLPAPRLHLLDRAPRRPMEAAIALNQAVVGSHPLTALRRLFLLLPSLAAHQRRRITTRIRLPLHQRLQINSSSNNTNNIMKRTVR